MHTHFVRLTSFAFFISLFGTACGPALVHLQGTEGMPEDQVTLLWSNPHLEFSIDRKDTLAADAKLKKIVLPAGHHALEVRCTYTDDVTYHAAKGSQKQMAPAAGPAPKFTTSPTIALLLEGEAGHAYKPRSRFEKDSAGIPGCRVRLVDVTNEPGGQKVDFF